MVWDFENNQAIYPQIVMIMKRRILSGLYEPGAKLPSVRDLAEESGVNPNTMQRALSELEREELVVSFRTSGRHVTEDSEKIKAARDEAVKELCKDFIVRMKKMGYRKEEIVEMILANEGEDDA